ncbi:DUF982 domain-containing protein [Rhizobium sp. GCM10022189]|uniref:DUF982 domain-containing protein n=1 Tax=Rhizobium sp. GCM10022189 TaxID=3252654 RepID=UPI00361C4086
MYDQRWERSVRVELQSHGTRIISTTREAADCLIDLWPKDHSKEFDEALRICLDVYEGNETPSAARKAFIAAAIRAAVPVEY